MKSGLWILAAVIIAGIIVGALLKGRVGPIEEAGAMAELDRIREIEDSEEKVSSLRAFIGETEESRPKAMAYSSIAREMLQALKDTTWFVDFARRAIADEVDSECKAVIYYYLYRVELAAGVEAGSLIGKELLDNPVDVGWIYNEIGFDLAERGENLDLAQSLCEKAIELARSRDDSATFLDSRGWVHYKRGMYKEAMADVETALRLSEEPSEEVLRHLAYAALLGGEPDKAFDTFRTILVMGEYEHARGRLDSLLKARGYSAKEIAEFDESIWQARMAEAVPAQAFDLATLQGQEYTYGPGGGTISVINFFSPT